MKSRIRITSRILDNGFSNKILELLRDLMITKEVVNQSLLVNNTGMYDRIRIGSG